ncbi:MAG: UxaA family hydrolase [Anaerolineales bacterium]
MVNALLIHPTDNVAVALRDLSAGEALCTREAGLPPVVTREAVPFGHKVAIRPIAKGAQVIKYGASIGLATRDIAPGEHVHVHNLTSVRGAVQR